MGITDSDLERHSNNLDAIRIIAALFVLVGHAPAILYNQGFSWDPINELIGMRIQTLGVCVFFVVSGFLVSRSWEQKTSTLSFFLSRLFRIFPALIVVVLLSVFVLGPCLTHLSIAEYFSSPLTGKYLQNISLFRMYYQLPGVFDNNPHAASVNGSLWTLPYEFFCYLTLMLLGLMKVLESRIVATIVLLGLIFQYLLFPVSIRSIVIPVLGIDFKNLFPLMIYFLTGMLYYQFRDKITFGLVGRLLSGIIICLIKANVLPQQFFAFVLPFLIFSYAFSKRINMRGFGKHGDFSYGFYLYAFPVQQLIVYLLPGCLNPVTMILFSAACTFPFAYLSWRLIEKPALGFRKGVLNSIGPL